MAGKIYVILIAFLTTTAQGITLKEVLILSRHNIRTPLTARLENTSPYEWPKWNNEVGHLTDKGALLESYMGDYIGEWLRGQELVPPGCPPPDDVFVYANTKQRTRESANAFVRGAFRNCNVSVYSIDSDEMDPVFNPVLRDTSEGMKEKITAEMLHKLQEIKLDDAYLELNKILDLQHSNICKTDLLCDFLQAENEVVYAIGQEPNIRGPLATSNNVVDSFIMSYYEGKPDEDVAWGRILNAKQWSLLSQIIKENQNVRFNSSALGRDVAKPLLQYIKEVFESIPHRKLTVLFGHDSNLNSVMAALGFKYYELPNQYEATPPGGKIVFQKWWDKVGHRELLKINYVYQTTEQIRNASRLTLDDPPLWAQLELTNCSVDNNGFCSWEKFQQILGAIL